MPHPEWIDQTSSEQLPILRDRGEGQHLEFMESYPTNGYELSREIAAFASSNPGTILIGVADDGTLVGLADAVTAAGRDALCRRIEGVCAGNIRPAITPLVKFAQESDAIILVIDIPRGKQQSTTAGTHPISAISRNRGRQTRTNSSSVSLNGSEPCRSLRQRKVPKAGSFRPWPVR